MDPFGINKLIDIILEFFWWFIPFTIVNHFEEGVVLRFGKFSRVLKAGFHWIWPFGIEEVLTENVKPDGSYTATQAITLKDGTSLAVTVIMVWEIKDVKQLILEIEDKDTVLTWAMGSIEDFLHKVTWEELLKTRAWAAENAKRHGLAEKLIKHVNDIHEEETGVHFRDIRIKDFTITGLRNGTFRILGSN